MVRVSLHGMGVLQGAVVAIVVLLLVPIAGASRAAADGTVNWTQMGFDAGRSSLNPFELVLGVDTVAGLHVLWDTALLYPGWQPIVADGVIVEGDGAIPEAISALDEATGAVLWTHAFGGFVIVSGTPTISRGVVYVQTVDYEGETGPVFYGFDLSTGAVLHHGTRTLGSPAARGGRLYTVVDGAAVAVSPDLWRTKWSDDAHPWSGTVAAAGGRVFIADVNGVLTAIDAVTGAEQWTASIPVTPGGGPAVEDGVLCIESWNAGTRGSTAYGLDAATGRVLWSDASSSAAPGTCSLADGIVYLTRYDTSVPLDHDELRAVDAQTGALLWSLTGDLGDAPSIANGVVYQIVDGHVEALDASSGEVLWQAPEFALHVSVVNGRVIADGLDVIAYGL